MQNPSRKFQDLFYLSTRHLLVWDQRSTVQVGDYGTIDKDTGQLDIEGNIHDLLYVTDPLPCVHTTDLSKDHPEPNPSGYRLIHRSYRKRRSTDLPDPSFAILEEMTNVDPSKCVFSYTAHFASYQPGLLLAFANANKLSLHPDTPVDFLTESPILKGKVIVKDVIYSPNFFRYLGPAGSSYLSVHFGELSTPPSYRVDHGAEEPDHAEGSSRQMWVYHSLPSLGYAESHLDRLHNTDEQHDTLQRPLPPDSLSPSPAIGFPIMYSLKKCAIRDDLLHPEKYICRCPPKAPVIGLDRLEDISLPWQPLDENGNEETIFDEPEDSDSSDDESDHWSWVMLDE